MNYDETAVKADDTARKLRKEARQEEARRLNEIKRNADKVKQAFVVLGHLRQSEELDPETQRELEDVEKGLLETAKQFFDQDIPSENLVEACRRFIDKLIKDSTFSQKMKADIIVNNDTGLSAVPEIHKTDFVPDSIAFSRGRKPDGSGRQVLISVGDHEILLERKAALAFYTLAAKNKDGTNTVDIARAILALKKLQANIDQASFSKLMQALEIQGKHLIDQDIPQQQLPQVLREFIRLPWQQRDPLMKSITIDPSNISFGDIPNITSDSFVPEKIQFYPGKFINGDGREIRFSVPIQTRSWNGRETKQNILVTLHGPAAEAFYNLALSSK